MSGVEGFGDKVAFVWSVADLLRGDVKAHENGQYILPFLVLRRLDCVLEPTKAEVLAKAKALSGKVENVAPILERVAGAPFYNVHPLTFTELLNDNKNIKGNLLQYIGGFSSEAAEVLDKYHLKDRVESLHKLGLLYQMVAKFADLDLRPSVVPNHAMGYIFEELLRRFSEMQNETAGEHFTPREVVRAMVNILFAEDEKALSGPAPVRTMLDPACGTGGMLSTAQDYLAELNPNAHLEVYGQELNPETWAICRSDMLIKGQDPEHIVLGNSLSADGHDDEEFDYLLANPPFGVKWDKYKDPIVDEHMNDGFDGRFGAGLPPITDGSFLFLQHMISKMKPVRADGTGGSRLAIVFSGSPLFSGAAESGQSNIRRWIIENDWLEAIVALPDQLFYNTGIYTYFWVVTNRKRPERKGKVALIDARGMASKMSRSLGNKRHYLSDETIDELARIYADAPDLDAKDVRVKVMPNEAFGFQRITVEQPLRRRWAVTKDTLLALAQSKAWAKWDKPVDEHGDAPAPDDIYGNLVDAGEPTEKQMASRVNLSTKAAGAPPAVGKELIKLAAVPDPDAPSIVGNDGNPLPDPLLRDYENVPLGEDVDEYLKREVKPYAPEAWIDHSKTRIGYEIPFARHFYVYDPPRPIRELDGEITERETKIRELLGGLL